MRKLSLLGLQDRIERQLWTQEACAEHYGCHVATILRECQRLGLKTQRTGPRGGAGHPGWKGGRAIDKDGYVSLWMPDHPFARKTGRILEHRVVMELHLRRYLHPREVVHHRNGKRSDNRIENLEAFPTNADHLRHELTGRIPRWTPAGKARILQAVRRSAIQRRSASGGRPRSRQKSRR